MNGLRGTRERAAEGPMNGLVAIRGAAQAEANTAAAIDATTRELLEAIVEANGIEAASIAAAWFTQTPDLTAVYPAESARRMGWVAVPMLCAQEAHVDGALPRTIRTMILVPADARPRHVYLGPARVLRPDLSDDHEGATS